MTNEPIDDHAASIGTPETARGRSIPTRLAATVLLAVSLLTVGGVAVANAASPTPSSAPAASGAPGAAGGTHGAMPGGCPGMSSGSSGSAGQATPSN
ncbi:MAG: hypothetical protein ACHQZR_03775 [Candidatus Limnocylindrales bacterium]